MNQRIKIFIVEYDCVNLITLMLWLDQYPEFEVLGTTVDSGNIREQVSQLKPDVVLLDISTPGPEDIPQLREVKSSTPQPAVVLLYNGLSKELEGVLKEESDGALGPDQTLKELYHTILNVHSQRQLVSSTIFPVAMAG